MRRATRGSMPASPFLAGRLAGLLMAVMLAGASPWALARSPTGALDWVAKSATRGDRAEVVQQTHSLGQSGFEHCPELFPGGRAVGLGVFDARWRLVELCGEAFAVLHSGLSRTPLLVVERLDRHVLDAAAAQTRTDEFFPDMRLPAGERGELVDFARSGWDRGHLASAAHQPSRRAMVQSFALSNVVAQDPDSNRNGAWLKAERDVRKFVRRAKGAVFVFSGPLFPEQPQTLGAGVWVPSHLFKLVYDQAGKRAWAHVVANRAGDRLGRPLSYESFVARTGLDLLASEGLEVVQVKGGR